jgi:hypothetical protein
MFRSFYRKTVSKAHLIDSLEKANYIEYQKGGCAKDDLEKSVAYGKAIAQAILAWAESDGFAKERPAFQPLSGEGKWIATPPAFSPPALPYWMENRPMTQSQKSSLKAPMAFSNEKNSDYYKMVNEVYTVSKNLTEEQKNIAWFWDDSPNGKYYSVFGHWSSILAQIIDDKKLPLMTGVEAFAKMSISQYNASMVCWKGKYEYAVLRPITYIQKYIDQTWTPEIETPPHPEYPAAHATFSAGSSHSVSQRIGKQCCLY